VFAGIATSGTAWAEDAPPAPPPPVPPVGPAQPPPAPARPPEHAEQIRRMLEEPQDAPDLVVRSPSLRLDGPLEVSLPMSPLGLGGGPVVPIDAGGARDVLSPRQVRELTPTTVEEIANRLPGVTSRLYSGDEHLRPSISVRGMPDNGFTEYTAVLVDGFNMSTLFYGWTAISIFPFTPERIWAAEVYRGAHALRFGPNTIGGVVNFVTAPIPTRPTFRERVILGSNGYVSTTTDVGGMTRDGRFGALLTYVDKGGDTWREDARFDVNELSLKTLWNIDRSSWLALDGAHWRDVHQLPLRLTREQMDEDRNQNPNPDEVDWKGWAYWGTLTYHRDFGCDSWAEAFVYHRKARRALESARPPPPAGPPFTTVRNGQSDMYNSGIELRGEFPFHAGTRHVLHWGLRYHREEIFGTKTIETPIGGGPVTLIGDAHTTNHVFSANVDDTVKIGKLTLNAGARFEYVFDSQAKNELTGDEKDFDFQEVFPGASAVYEFTPCWSVFGNYHKSFRPPQTFSYDFTRPDQEFEYEHGTNVEIGTRFRPRGLDASLVLWQVDFSDFIEFDPDEMVTTNHGAFRSRGIDVVWDLDFGALDRRLCGLSTYGSVTIQESKFENGPNEGNDTQSVPPWFAVASLRYEHRSGFYGVVDGTYREKMPVTVDNSVDTPGYGLAGVRAGWRKEFCAGRLRMEIDAALAVKNLFDRDVYLRHVNIGSNDATFYVPGPPQELFLDIGIGIEL
jgi:Fe(3+) dicitrate transport protein